MKPIKTFEVEVTAIQDIEGTGFREKVVEDADIVDFSLGNMDERRDRAAQIQKRMKFDGGFVFAESGPRKKRKTKIDCCCVEGINGFVQIDAERIAGIKMPGGVN